jgi:hypothetical protein
MILCCSFRRFISSENTLLKTCTLYITKNNGKENLYLRIKPVTVTRQVVEWIFADKINRYFNMLEDSEGSDVDFLSLGKVVRVGSSVALANKAIYRLRNWLEFPSQ